MSIDNTQAEELTPEEIVSEYNSKRKVWKKKRINPKVKYKQNIDIVNGWVQSHPYFCILFERLHGKIVVDWEVLDDVHHYNLSFRWNPRTLVQEELTVMYLEEAVEEIKRSWVTIWIDELKQICIEKADKHFNMILVAMKNLEDRWQSPFKWFNIPLDFEKHNGKKEERRKAKKWNRKSRRASINWDTKPWDADDATNDETNAREGQDDSRLNSVTTVREVSAPEIESRWGIISRIFWWGD